MTLSLAHFIARHRWPVIAVWIVLTFVGAVAEWSSRRRWNQSSTVPGQPAYEAASARSRSSAPACARRTCSSSSGDRRRRAAIGQRLASMPGARLPERPTARAAHASRARPPAGQAASTARARPSGCGGGRRAALPEGMTVESPGATRSTRPASTGAAARAAGRGADRRHRRAGRPAVRVRDAARRADAAGRRDRRDHQHLHARLGAHPGHRRRRSSCSS